MADVGLLSALNGIALNNLNLIWDIVQLEKP